MVENTQALDEVIAVCYGTQRKATLTGLVSAVGKGEIVITKNENVGEYAYL
ncbi:TonB-linked outer membrane protein, SusC/RagA family [Bacteroidales bacterium Barb6]|nr:TonB-linked outer membrane protein, SusC/RagA family [Bacteroidales bacterium Barb6]